MVDFGNYIRSRLLLFSKLTYTTCMIYMALYFLKFFAALSLNACTFKNLVVLQKPECICPERCHHFYNFHLGFNSLHSNNASEKVFSWHQPGIVLSSSSPERGVQCMATRSLPLSEAMLVVGTGEFVLTSNTAPKTFSLAPSLFILCRIASSGKCILSIFL